MKKIVTVIMVFCLVFSMFSISTFAASSKETIRVNKTTYQNYRKAYKKLPKVQAENKKLKKEIQSQGEEIYALKKQVADLESALENTNPNDDIDELKHRLEQQESINDWLWMSIKSLGISYSNKSWTVPTEYPQTFMVNGTKYRVFIQEAENEN